MANHLNSPIPEDLPDQIAALIFSGGTLGEAYDYSDTDYEAIYALGHSLYSQARYQDAMRTFGALVMFNHLEKRYMNAFASSLQMLENYKEAIRYYSFASFMDLSDPLPTFHTAECMMALGYKTEAKEALGFVLRQCTTPERAPLKERAEAMQELMEEKNTTSATDSEKH